MSYNKRSTKTKKRAVKKKKAKINKKKLLLLLSIVILFTFGMSKAISGVTKVAKSINSSDKKVSPQNNKEQVSKEQPKKEEISNKTNLQTESTNNQNEQEIETVPVEKKYSVVIDPGHGGSDPGNTGYSSKQPDSKLKIYEKDIALQVSKKVAAELSKQNDIQIVLTRADDTYVGLDERVGIAKKNKGNVFVSIHMNAEYGGSSAIGLETYYSEFAKDKSQVLAQTVQGTIGSYVTVKDRGIKSGDYQILNTNKIPSILIECGFITTYKEEQKLIDEEYQNKLAEGIAQGILTFIDKNIAK